MARQSRINRQTCTAQVVVTHSHVGLYDVVMRRPWIAQRRFGIAPQHVSHASLLANGASADKDRFVCYWFYTPGVAQGAIHGQRLSPDEGHLIVRFDPYWNHLTCRLIVYTDTARLHQNAEQQYAWGRRLFEIYTAQRPRFPVSWHMVGPRPADSTFNIETAEPDTALP